MRIGLLSVLMLLTISPRFANAQGLELLLAAPGAVNMLKEYVGIVESMDSKVDRLTRADLKTSWHLLRQAKNNPAQSHELIKEARVHFTRAIAIESDATDEASRHRHALALLGLWMCCEIENDKVNANDSLKSILKISSKPSTALTVRYNSAAVPVSIPATAIMNLIINGEAESKVRGKEMNEANLRLFDADFDGLLSIQSAVRKKLEREKVIRP
ncbi:hypothetical protein GC197_14935 [bacterium]|nr:hypothetical protein [bacterium]